MKLIVRADAEDISAVVSLILENAHWWDNQPERLGSGWVWPIPNGKRFFVRQIKHGFSANPAKVSKP